MKEKDFQDYINEGFIPVRCKGYHQKYNPNKDYKVAKQPIDRDYTSEDFNGCSDEEIEKHVQNGGWMGFLLPKGVIAIDTEDNTVIQFIESLIFGENNHSKPAIAVTNNGKHFLYRTDNDISPSTNEYTKLGVPVTYRSGKKSYLILPQKCEGVENRRWENWIHLKDLPYLSDELKPYDSNDKVQVLYVLSWEIHPYVSKLLNGYDDFDTSFMAMLVECGFALNEIENAFVLIFLEDYDKAKTQQMYERAKKKLEQGERVRSTGSFINKINELGLNNIIAMTNRLLSLSNHYRNHLKDLKTQDVEVSENNPFSAEKFIPEIPFPKHIFPEQLRGVIEKISSVLQVETAMVGSVMLSLISGVIGNTVRIVPKEGFEQPLFLWLIVIAKTGGGKSPVLSTLSKYIKSKQSKMYNDFKEKMESYKTKLKAFEKDKNGSLEKPQMPKMQHLIASDTTVEALSSIFESTPRGVIILCDEMSGFIQGLNQYKNKGGNDRQQYLTLWNAEEWFIDRKGTGHKTIPNTGAAIVGGIQTQVVKKFFDSDSFDDGFLPRFLIFQAHDKPKRHSKKGLGNKDIAPWEGLIDFCYNIPLNVDENGYVQHQSIKLDDVASEIFFDFLNRYEDIMHIVEDQEAAFIPKLQKYSTRIACVLHVLEAFFSEQSELSEDISKEVMENAVMLTEYFAGQAVKLVSYYKTGLKEYQKKLIMTLYTLREEVKNGRLSISRITDVVNRSLGETQFEPKQIGAFLRNDFELNTIRGTGGYYFLQWDEEKIDKLFAPLIFTMSTMSTIKNDIIDVTRENLELESVSSISVSYRLVSDKDDLISTVALLSDCEVIAIDIKTTGLDPLKDKVRFVLIAAKDYPVIVVDLFQIAETDLNSLKELFIGSSIKVFHNAVFALNFLFKASLSVKGGLFDTMLAAQLIDVELKNEALKLANLTEEYLGEKLPKDQQASDWSGVHSEKQVEYAARDAAILLRLRETLVSKLMEAELTKVAELEFDCIQAIAELELNGILVDKDKLEALHIGLKAQKNEALNELKEYLGEINPNSPDELEEALNSIGVNVKGTSKDALKPFSEQHPVIKPLLEYKKATKYQEFTQNYLEHIHPLTKRIHARYNQIGAVTGRTYCQNPNLMNIPRDKVFRSCFVPSPGCKLVIADFSQIELRVTAEISQDKRMIEAYKKGDDLHLLTASLILEKPLEQVTKEERQAAKAINFGLIYSMGAAGLKEYARNRFGVNMSNEQAKTFRDRFFDFYQGIAVWHERLRREGSWETRTIAGRRRQWKKQPPLTELCNTPIQGTAADINKKALAMLPTALQRTGGKIIVTVHDEIVVEVPEEKAKEVVRILEETMIRAGQEYLHEVPVEVEVVVTDNWAKFVSI